MNCPNCGAAVPAGLASCRKCGSSVQVTTQQQTQPTVQVVIQTGQGASQQVPMEGSMPAGPAVKSKLAAGLLGIFLGSLGIHRFYLGYTGIGVAQIILTLVVSWFTCGISAMAAGIWGLIEGILILTGAIDRDAQNRPLRE